MAAIPCQIATAPVNIDSNQTYDDCKLKCQLTFDYNTSSCTATHRDNYISLSYDQTTSPPVSFNLSGYTVFETRIYVPSLHSYNNSQADGEIIIVHNSDSGKPPLLICIPIKKGNSNTSASTALAAIVKDVKNNANSVDSSTAVTMQNFNLNDFVPRKPFYSYIGTEPYLPCTATNNIFVVFTPNYGYVDIATTDFNILSTLISKHLYTLKPIKNSKRKNIAFNKKGPVSGKNDGQIYIDCQPVGQSDDTVTVVTGTSNTGVYDIVNNPFMQFFLGTIIFILFIWIVNKLLSIFKPAKVLAKMSGGGISSSGISGSGSSGISSISQSSSFLQGMKNIII